MLVVTKFLPLAVSMKTLVAACSGQGVMLDARMLVVGRDPASRS